MKNRLTGLFENPVAERCEVKDYIECLTKSLSIVPVDSLRIYREHDVYFVGTFNTTTAEIKYCAPEFLSSLELICDQLILLKSKKENEDVGEEQHTA